MKSQKRKQPYTIVDLKAIVEQLGGRLQLSISPEEIDVPVYAGANEIERMVSDLVICGRDVPPAWAKYLLMTIENLRADQWP